MSFLIDRWSGWAPTVLALACVISTNARAQTASDQTVVVTGARQPQSIDDTLADVTVIGRDELEAQGPRALSQVLAMVPGIQISASGGPGTATSVFIRGAEGRDTLLLIDGVPYGSATLGLPVWDTVPLSQIERVEILRGPAAALYGSSALGGVIQVITRRGAQGFAPNASLQAGSDSTFDTHAGFAGGQGAWTYALQAQHFQTEGFSATNAHVPFGDYNPDRDPFMQTALSGHAQVRLSPDWSLDTAGLVSDSLVHYDDGPSVDSRTGERTRQVNTTLDGRLNSRWTTTLRLAGNTDNSDTPESTYGPSDFKTSTQLLQWQNNVATPLGTLLAAAERLRQSVKSTTAYVVTERSIRSVLLGLTGAAGPHHWQGNVRRDDNSQFGRATTGSVGYGLDLGTAWRITASHGTSFVAPSFNQLYYPDFGNANLQPEHGRSSEVGLRWEGALQSVKLTAFDNRIRSFFDSTDPMAAVSRARITGQSLAWALHARSVTVNASLDLMRPRDEATGLRLARRADRQFTLSADQHAGAATWGAALLAVGDRFEDSANTPSERMASYATLDLHGSYRLQPAWTIDARVNNLANRAYETAYGYNQPGRQVFVGLRYAPRP
jgi:vitamin B12 transporter